jgi:hypothetical protein
VYNDGCILNYENEKIKNQRIIVKSICYNDCNCVIRILSPKFGENH